MTEDKNTNVQKVSARKALRSEQDVLERQADAQARRDKKNAKRLKHWTGGRLVA